MQVLKFGGSSVSSTQNIERVFNIVNRAITRDKTILVVSAIGGCTDTLIKTGYLAEKGDKGYEKLIDELEKRHIEIIESLIVKDFHNNIKAKTESLFNELRAICNGVFLIKEISRGTMDMIMSFGELLSSSIIYEKFLSAGLNCKWVDARELIITEFRNHQNMVLRDKTSANIRNMIEPNNCKLYMVPGFISSDNSGRTTTLGRGGSDYTASLIAAAIDARVLEIWTDVDGMMTADPRIVPDAITINHISYKEALELSHFGAKVIYPPTIQPVISRGISIQVKNTFNPDSPGTLIEKNPPEGSNKIKGISGSGRIAILSMEGSGMVGIPGYSSRLFDVLSKNDINIILITQASSVHTMLVAIDESDAAKAKSAVDELFAYEISLNRIEPLKIEMGFSIISLVGDDMKNQSGAGGRMFEAIGSKGINIRAIAQGSSEKNVSAVVRTEDFDEAVRAIHEQFFGDPKRVINLFIAGYGNVGKTLVKMILTQRGLISERSGIDLNIIGICNSKGMVFDQAGLDIERIEASLPNNTQNGFSPSQFIENIARLSYKNSLFVDCTADMGVSMLYREILSEKIGIVTCNKIANSIDYKYYKDIHSTAGREGIPFRYETNVGAALPIISTIKQIIASGDEISSVEATLSGSLNYLFNNYKAEQHFADIVRYEQSIGYTEPDPRTDLMGVDVLRKALIIGREIGIEAEAGDVAVNSFLPEACLKGDVDQFYRSLEENEEYFKNLYISAKSKNEKLLYCTEIRDGKISIGLKSLGSTHPFYNLRDSDNAITIYTKFYPNGISISGAGAGASQTSSGLLNDILASVNMF